jgi:hypothetical protein
MRTKAKRGASRFRVLENRDSVFETTNMIAADLVVPRGDGQSL